MDRSTSKKASRACSDDSSSSDSDGEFSYKNFHPRKKKTRRNDAGRRYQKGILYCSSLGITCHFCRQKTTQKRVVCRSCEIAYCAPCLRKRHGEDLEVELAADNWLCPKCRGGCGLGCKNCCNCTFCRKKQGLKPPKITIGQMQAHGFDNVHDYLIHLETGESPEKISSRKTGKGWCSSNGKGHSKSVQESQIPKQINKEIVGEATSRVSRMFQESVRAGQPGDLARDPCQNDDALQHDCQHVRYSHCDDNSDGYITRLNSAAKKLFTSTEVETNASKEESSFPEQFTSKNEFKDKLEAKLAEPFDAQEMKNLWDAITRRKPMSKLNGGHEETSAFLAKELGYSYSQHHPDFVAKYTATGEADVKLRLLRGFFFWLEHASMSGSYKPWKEKGDIDEECIELNDLDCQVLGVLVNVEKEKQTQNGLEHWENEDDVKPDIKAGFLESLVSQSKPAFNWDEEDVKPKVEELKNWRSSGRVQAG